MIVTVANAANAAGQSSSHDAATAEQPIHFDIHAQPLATAIDAYTAATGLEVLFDSNLATDRRSTAVNGVLVPDVALRILLEGTDLTAVYGVKAFAIVPITADRRTSTANLPERIPYLGIVQDDIERAFCRHSETMPGSYRLAVRFSIGAAGEVLNPQLLSSTGDLHRDELITGLFKALSIEQPPPPGLPQPVTMIVLPRPPAQTGDCNSTEGRRRATQ